MAQIFDLNTQFFKKNFDHASVPEIQVLHENPNKPDEKYPFWAPVLFPNNDVNSIHPFKTDQLISVCIEICAIACNAKPVL